MDNITALIQSLNPAEYKQLEKYMEYKNSYKDRKDKQLLKILSTDSDLPTDEVIKQLYNTPAETSIADNKRNTYHQWRSILSEQIEDFALQLIKQEDSSLYIVKLVLIARFLLLRKKYKPAYRYLQKAEDIAQKIERYELLHRIYAIQIEYVWSQQDIDMQVLIEKWKKNLELEHKETFVNTALGVIKKQLKDATIQGLSVDIDVLTEEVLAEYNVNTEIRQNANTRYRLAMMVQIALEEKGDFKQMLDYLIHTFQTMLAENMFDKHNQRLKINLLTHIFRAAVNNKEYKTGQVYLDLLKKENALSPENAVSNIRSLMVEYVLLACTDRLKEAWTFIHELEYSPIIKANWGNDYCFCSFHSNLISSNYMMGNLKAAQKYLAIILNNEKRIRQQHGYAGILEAHLIDCMVNIDKQEYDYVLTKLKAIQKRFLHFLKQPENVRYTTYMKILKELAQKADPIANEKFREEIKHFIASKKIQIGGNYEFIPFNAYLSAKIQNRRCYDVFLEMINKN